jgi:S-(hydroxymethyl)glutathione dehydrogenase/alcohol dehydrogenase
VEAKLTVIVQVAQGAKMCGASKIIGVDLNPNKEEVGKSINFPFAK